MDDISTSVSSTIDQESEDLTKLSDAIWNQPELAFQEHFAHAVLTDFLENTGFVVEKSFKLETAFRATYRHPESNSGPNIAILCEYDALPGLGHACGHNLIAEAGVAAALAAKASMIANQDSNICGTVRYKFFMFRIFNSRSILH
jgi:metal-dependent amidase/aminoacylase/carboxypeptidase family protein